MTDFVSRSDVGKATADVTDPPVILRPSMNDDFDPADLPPLRDVDYGALAEATTESPFTREGFELLKDASIVLTTVAGLHTETYAPGLARNHAIIVGHYARSIKLIRSLIRQVSDGHGGDQQIAISREFMDSLSTVMYLLGDSGDGTRFDSYVMDSLVAEREFLKDVRTQITGRDDVILPIEERINRSIHETLAAAGVKEEDIPSRRVNGWPSAQTRLELLGPTAYAAYRIGSGAVHGSFNDIYKHHLAEVDGGFEIQLRPQPFRPQPLLSMALLSLTTLDHYCRTFFGMPLPPAIASRRDTLLSTLCRVDELHENWLNERRKSSAP